MRAAGSWRVYSLCWHFPAKRKPWENTCKPKSTALLRAGWAPEQLLSATDTIMSVQGTGTRNFTLQCFVRGYGQSCSIVRDYAQRRRCGDGHCFPQTLEASCQSLDIFCNRQHFGCRFESVASFLNTLGVLSVGKAHGATKL